MIIVTGGAGFIGSAFVWRLNQEGITDIIIVDSLKTSEKWRNLVGLQYDNYLHKDDFLDMVLENALPKGVEAIVHMGACSATTELDGDYLMENNYRYTQILADWAIKKNVRFIYASSAATYGNGHHGFDDDHDKVQLLRPINRYGYSKHFFDLASLRHGLIDHCVGLKFFNVFGPNEYHKGEMRSVVCKAHREIFETGKIQLFKSHRPDYGDGEQKRDFIYIKDVVDAMWYLLNNRKICGVFNLGTGQARSWNEVARALFAALGREPQIDYFDMPKGLRNQYQYFTQANMEKLKTALPNIRFRPLEDTIKEYVVDYLNQGRGL